MLVKTEKIYFIGLLQNVDSTILNVRLENNFQFSSISEEEGIELFSSLEGLPPMKLRRKLSIDYHCLNPALKQYFFVKNSFDVRGILIEDFWGEYAEFENKLVNSYLKPKIRLMRLFKEGNIGMPLTYCFFKKTLVPTIRESTHIYQSPGPRYTLNTEEIDQLQAFLKKYDLPFKHGYIQLAFENFETSYEVRSINIAFLSLMNGLEALFNPGEHELRYRLSRNCAVLLGTDRKNSNDIYEDIKQLYDLRSAIVHAYKKVTVKQEDLYRLRDYVRRSIKTLLKVDKPKNEALKVLDSIGFGQFQQVEYLNFPS